MKTYIVNGLSGNIVNTMQPTGLYGMLCVKISFFFYIIAQTYKVSFVLII